MDRWFLRLVLQSQFGQWFPSQYSCLLDTWLALRYVLYCSRTESALLLEPHTRDGVRNYERKESCPRDRSYTSGLPHICLPSMPCFPIDKFLAALLALRSLA